MDRQGHRRRGAFRPLSGAKSRSGCRPPSPSWASTCRTSPSATSPIATRCARRCADATPSCTAPLWWPPTRARRPRCSPPTWRAPRTSSVSRSSSDWTRSSTCRASRALFHPGLETLAADLPVVGGADGYGTSKAQVEIYARGLQDAGAPVNITYPGMVLGPPVGDQFGEAGEGVRAALQMHAIPGRNAAWLIVDVRDVAALHAALLEPGRGPRRYMAGGHRVPAAELAHHARPGRRHANGRGSDSRHRAARCGGRDGSGGPVSALRHARSRRRGCSTTPRCRRPTIRRASATSASPTGIHRRPWPTRSRPFAPRARACPGRGFGTPHHDVREGLTAAATGS